jgi:5-methylcytosine-specific restriction endonuclease McrA
MTKVCTECGNEFPATTEYFHKDKRKKCGLKSSCKLCLKKYRQLHREDILEYQKEYYVKNVEIIKKKGYERYHKNRREILEDKGAPRNKICNKCGKEFPATTEYFYEYSYHTATGKKCLMSYCKICTRKSTGKYKNEHKEQYVAYAKDYRKKYYQENKEREVKRSSLWYEKNKERNLVNGQKWREANRERSKLILQRRINKKRQLPSDLTNEQWIKCLDYFNNECAYCGKNGKLTIEHFVPLSNGGELTINNIICVCRSCNSSKQAKDFFEWYPKQKFYSKKRERKILKFLNYNNGIQQLAINM